jgi:hypothetical protein
VRGDSRPQGESGGHVLVADGAVHTVAVGQGPRHPSDPMQTPSGETAGLEFVSQKCRRLAGHRCVSIQIGAGQPPVQHSLPLDRHVPDPLHTFVDDGRALAAFASEKIIGPGSMRHHANVEAIEQRPREASSVLGQCRLVAFARTRRSTAARTGIGGTDQRETRRQSSRRVGATQTHHTFFQRLSKRVERRGCELTEFVEEEHTPVGETHLSRT